MTRILSLSLLLVLFVSASGCDNSSTEGDAPELIAPDLFSIDTNFFNTAPNAKVQTRVNFTNAAFRVWPVSLVLSASMILPAAVTAAATQASPEFSDGAWRWNSSASSGGSSVAFGLAATPSGTGHDWSATVSYFDSQTQAQLTNFELFSGRTQDGGTSGNWQLYLPIDGTSTNVLNADFTRDSETEKSVTFSIPVSADVNAGDSVTYTENGTTRIFEWTQVTGNVTHTIEWDSVTGAGSITATNFNEGIRGCWDDNQDDIPCQPLS